MPVRPGEPNTLLVMVLMVMGVPPLSMVGRHETATNLLLLAAGIARSEPPWTSFGVAALWLVGILGEGGEEGIGQNDHFMVVQFAHVRIRQNDYSLGQLSLLAGQRRTMGTPYKGALRMWLRLSV